MSPFLIAVLAAASVRGTTTGGDEPQIAECRIGFNGHFKVGFWTPIWVAVSGDVAGRPLRVEATTIDSDGVPVSTAAQVETGGESAEGLWPVLLYTKVGRIGAPVHLSLFAEDDSVLDRFDLSPNADREGAGQFKPLSATSELMVHVGALAIGLEEAYHQQDNSGDATGRALVRLLDVDALPTDWFGYEAVDVLVLTTGDAQLMRRLATDRRRFDALRQWLELGGRLVVLCGGEATQELLTEGGPLAALVPGKFAEMVRLPETGPLEHFAKSDVPVAPRGARARIVVPQVVEAEGAIEVYAGRRPSDLPLVVRTARGLGEVAFVGVDLSQSPLSEWPGRKAFLQAVLRPYLAQRNEGEEAQSLVARGYNDLSGALRQRLGRSFVGVAPFTFSVVTVLAVAYLLVLGPVDYLVVHRWLRRPWVAWLSFPFIVLVFGMAAMVLADWRQAGVGPRINRLEVVDIDTVTGQVRGTFWATLYSPHAEQFDLALDVESLGGGTQLESQVLLSWWGLPGVGIGGMHAGGAELGIVRGGYRYGPELDSLADVPVLTSSTKSLLARWTATATRVIDAQLADADGLVEGFIENRTAEAFHNVRLLYNGWAYRLGNLEPGGQIEVGDEISPRRVKTVVTQDALGPTASSQADGNVFVAQQATAEQILSLMMFYEAAGGFGFAQLADDYQAYCDLSRLLELGRAILIAEVPQGGSRLVDAGTGEVFGDKRDAGAVVYRFVLPVATKINER